MVGWGAPLRFLEQGQELSVATAQSKFLPSFPTDVGGHGRKETGVVSHGLAGIVQGSQTL